jgi:2-phospho-L-lactate guanylyltransferase (CobY/MobA/RfbA family)
MALAPPQALTPAFGPRSLAGHIAAATAAGLPPRLEHSSSLALDVDTKADLDLLCELLGRQPERAPHSAALLRERCTESVK